jgi:hypothetical protein
MFLHIVQATSCGHSKPRICCCTCSYCITIIVHFQLHTPSAVSILTYQYVNEKPLSYKVMYKENLGFVVSYPKINFNFFLLSHRRYYIVNSLYYNLKLIV